MRLFLTVCCLSALALSGCAESLTGPETAVGVDPIAFEANEDVPSSAPTLYTTWVGSDDQVAYELTFSQADTGSLSTSRFTVVGTGVCQPDATLPSTEASECTVTSGLFRDDFLSFAIENDRGDVFAKASGRPDREFSILTMDLVYADGTQSSVKFTRP